MTTFTVSVGTNCKHENGRTVTISVDFLFFRKESTYFICRDCIDILMIKTEWKLNAR